MKKVLFIKFTVFFIAAFCSVANAENLSKDLTKQCLDSSKCTESEIVKILSLPPEPDEEKNHSNILGIGYEDGIRDDLERKVGLALFHNNQARAIYNRQAELWTEMVLNQNDISKLKELSDENRLASACISRKYIETPSSLSSFEDQAAMGFDRLILRDQIQTKIRRAYGYPDRPSDDKVKKYCDSFK
tara:strand:- start:671 stop:1234 length:564 start_codon:yes stop_codon:yes gene_type:complete